MLGGTARLLGRGGPVLLMAVVAAAGCSASPSGAFSDAEPVEIQFRPVVALVAEPDDAATGGFNTDPDGEVTVESVWDKVGQEAAELAQAIDEPLPVGTHPELGDTVQPFITLSAAEVAVLPFNAQLYLPTIVCAQLDARDLELLEPNDEGVLCDAATADQPRNKYLLGPSELDSSQLESAESIQSQSEAGKWLVSLTLTDDGAKTFESLSARHVGKQLAIVAGDSVVSAPTINAPITGNVIEISGDFDADESGELADQINAGIAQ